MSGGGTELSSSGSDGDNKAEPWRVKVSYLSGTMGAFLIISEHQRGAEAGPWKQLQNPSTTWDILSFFFKG